MIAKPKYKYPSKKGFIDTFFKGARGEAEFAALLYNKFELGGAEGGDLVKSNGGSKSRPGTAGASGRVRHDYHFYFSFFRMVSDILGKDAE